MQTHCTRNSNKGVVDIHKMTLREYVSRNQNETPGLLNWGNDDGGTRTVPDSAADIPRWITESVQLNSTRLRFCHHSKLVFLLFIWGVKRVHTLGGRQKATQPDVALPPKVSCIPAWSSTPHKIKQNFAHLSRKRSNITYIPQSTERK